MLLFYFLLICKITRHSIMLKMIYLCNFMRIYSNSIEPETWHCQVMHTFLFGWFYIVYHIRRRRSFIFLQCAFTNSIARFAKEFFLNYMFFISIISITSISISLSISIFLSHRIARIKSKGEYFCTLHVTFTPCVPTS